MRLRRLIQHEYGIFSVDSVYRHLDSYAAKRVEILAKANKISTVYAYEDGALEIFKSAKKHNLKCVYDLPIAYYQVARSLLEEEAERLPAWKETLVGTDDSPKKMLRKKMELELADTVICPSQFVYDSVNKNLSGSQKAYVIPFGSPDVSVYQNTNFRKEDKLRVLFVGSMSQRKGLSDLFEAMKLLDPNSFELHVLGSPIASLSFYEKQYPSFIYHPPRPHEQVLSLMKECDVFVLPSIVEGRALVQQEALSCGLPIIVTRNAGAEDLVADQKAGFLVPIRNPESIAEKLNILHRDRDLLLNMKKAAQFKANQVSWDVYRKQLIDVIHG